MTAIEKIKRFFFIDIDDFAEKEHIEKQKTIVKHKDELDNARTKELKRELAALEIALSDKGIQRRNQKKRANNDN